MDCSDNTDNNSNNGNPEENSDFEISDILNFYTEKGSVTDPQSMTFSISGEEHTLGNALRYIIIQHPEVEYCGYSIPHPSEDKLNIRIQTTENTTAIDAMRKGLEDLKSLCAKISETFYKANRDFDEKNNIS
ncbi:RBP11-like subunits of RNA polymerase [Rhizophagus irregularis]|uniref:DNA-directed RNA polymerases I and III subunit RPAC2 n=2 Tax=Rhizophagus irregularis TaxID=588596 RepID=A0A2N0PF90_9GLOM|nr:DNA-directed RNA polymerase [Rhizophagus irregularis DAOM 181602=DAOM 197198]PKC05491.1 RBP11-like subunits of RNA polymerase [Rhizophagus irregularis]PKC64980.1 RBP11-like subunits of RNA polymerase [Rhizophagus irregularis]PKK66652.1 RBP11-like subunits of RNA polymerase [Rhizophagus irregularis]POG77343.1 DNA-directed RNA polymerase [Rhizophagus irregularis DAOM 181602=DAOM 197198]|eukprot:XP_025184209.1 DNA-directed RNA polymerase [Rhizophagus irregularis DAOM 181602=DAOM 197198]